MICALLEAGQFSVIALVESWLVLLPVGLLLFLRLLSTRHWSYQRCLLQMDMVAIAKVLLFLCAIIYGCLVLLCSALSGVSTSVSS